MEMPTFDKPTAFAIIAAVLAFLVVKKLAPTKGDAPALPPA